MITSSPPLRPVQLRNWQWLPGLALVPLFLIPGWWSWLGLLLFGAIQLVVWRLGSRGWQKSGLDLPIGLVILGLGVGLFASLDMQLSLNRAASLVAGLVLFYTLSTTLSSAQVIRWGGVGLVGLGALAGLASLLATNWGQGELVKLPLLYDHLPHLQIGSFGSGASGEQEFNPRVVGGALAMLVTLAWLQLPLVRSRWRWLLGVAALFMTGLLLLTQAPSAIGGVAGAVAIFGLWRLTRGRRWLFWLTGLVTLAIGGAGLWWVFQRLPVPTAEPTRRIIFRMEMWLRSLDMLADKPFSGIGLNNFPQSINNFYPTYSLGPEAHAHNLWLQTALDGGILNLLALLAVLAGVGRLLYRAWQGHKENRAARYLIIGVACGTLAWLFYGFIESVTLAHKPALILWAMWGLVAVLARDYKPQPRTSKNWVRIGLVGAGVAVLVLAGLLAGGWDRLRLNLALNDAQRMVLGQIATPTNPQLFTLLDSAGLGGSVSAADWDLGVRLALRQDDFARFSRYLASEVRLDSQNPIDHYIPTEWKMWPNPAPVQPEPLVRLYQQWKIRYAQDPLAYARLAMAQSLSCNPAQAQVTLQEGLAQTKAEVLNYLQTTGLPVCS